MGAGGGSYGGATYTRGGVTYSTTTGLFTVPTAGLYLVCGFINLALNGSAQAAGAYWQINVLKGGSSIAAGPAEPPQSPTHTSYQALVVTDTVVCAANDTLGLSLFGANLSSVVAINNYVFSVTLIG
jgi:hypothetical protein